MGYELVAVASMDPKRVFWCALCDEKRKAEKRGVPRRFLVKMRTPGGEEGDYCIVCASRLTGQRQGHFMRAGRAAKSQV